ncbi:hypothetical protein BBK82_36080 [Lentzea guizhouensis]|uniref:YfbU family protein n=1 Tax=Lentzea guizhouensis TaxID=1586287 RepID=A0A1B2HSE4_9PSEU|nr:YfbU family protein [Lentzea guizhouensis]ANZ40621.1 hypothetical protein BBK82_36080 [Lentzea guizhouensis]
MATLTLRVEDSVRDELERAARAQGTTVSNLLRTAIDTLLGFGDGDAPDRDAGVVVPRTLDVVQRKTFTLLHQILARLPEDDEDDRDYHRRLAEVMTDGFTEEYHSEFGYMSAELTPAECTRLNDFLEMFRVLEHSLEQLPPADRERLGTKAQHILVFDGFDMNKPDESRMLSYARHLVKDKSEGRWSKFRERLTTGERGNSHSSRLARYNRMLSAYRSILDRKRSGRGFVLDAYQFDVDDLTQMIEAARYATAQH